MQAVLARKLVVPEVYDLMGKVQELMIRSQAAPVRQACSTVCPYLSQEFQSSTINFIPLTSPVRWESIVFESVLMHIYFQIIAVQPNISNLDCSWGVFEVCRNGDQNPGILYLAVLMFYHACQQPHPHFRAHTRCKTRLRSITPHTFNHTWPHISASKCESQT